MEPHADLQAFHLIRQATATVERFKSIKGLQNFSFLIPKAHAVLIFPEVYKGGFVWGGETGTGVLIAQRSDGSWGAPAFYTIGAASFGAQIGVQEAEVIMLVRNMEGLTAVLNDQVKFGADTGITFAVYGIGVEAATTTNIGADIVALANSKLGAYLGSTLKGSLIAQRKDMNTAIYGANYSSKDIVLKVENSHQQIRNLRNALEK